MNISGKTKVVGIFGYPIEHTLSPVMHNSAFLHLGLDYIYLPFQVKEVDLKYAVLSIKALDIRGVNVTIPHKEKVIKYLDEVSDDVLKIGAVNTILNNNGKLIGFNTDKFGFIKSITQAGITLQNKKVLVLGCGGASRAVCFGLLEEGIYSLYITDIFEKKAKKLKNDLKKFYKDKDIKVITTGSILEVLSNVDILVNATPVGMKPNTDASPVDTFEKSNNDLIVCDLVYNPVETKLIKMAKKQKLKTISGIDMLVWQGAKAFEIWTGIKPPYDIMREKVYKCIKT